MIHEKILILRKKLDESIKSEKDYEIIYKLSIELDELIAEYYNSKLKEKINTPSV